MSADGRGVTALPVQSVDGWKAGDLVRIAEGRGTIFSFSPHGGYCKVKLLGTGELIPVRVSALQTGKLS